MSHAKPLIRWATALLLLVGGVSSAWADKRTENTLIGVGIGGVAGAVLSDSDPLVTLGSAAVGGVLGSVLTDDERRRGHGHWKHNHRGHYHSYRSGGYHGHPKHRGRGHGHHRHHRH